jgi:hypothetical protein
LPRNWSPSAYHRFLEDSDVRYWPKADIGPATRDVELAEEHSVAIDFGCRAGSCGTCVTRLLSGSVRYLHQPNAPLEAREILPCVAVPAEPLTLDV